LNQNEDLIFPFIITPFYSKTYLSAAASNLTDLCPDLGLVEPVAPAPVAPAFAAAARVSIVVC